MPWHIGEDPSCDGFAVIKDSDGSVAGCHASEEDAKKQLAALYASEPEARAKFDHIDFTPPSGVREEANRGLEWRREFGRGGTAIGIARARDLGNGVSISPDTARRMKAFFDRHQSDRNAEGWSPGEKGFPSNGRIAHALWGGDAGYAWSRKLVRQMNAADEARSISEFLDTRGFCPTGKGGGQDNSCSSKGGGGGKSEGGGENFKKSDSFGKLPDGWGVGNETTTGLAFGFLGSRGPGPGGAEFKAQVTQNGRGGSWRAEVWSYRTDGSVGNQYQNKEGFRTRDEAIGSTRQWGRGNEDGLSKAFDGGGSSSSAPKTSGAPKASGSGAKKKRSLEMQIETRSLCLDDFSEDDAFPLLKIERRCEREGGLEETWLVGYAARFGATSLKMDDFYERIDPEAFGIVTERRGRKSRLETRALFNHDPNHLLGRYPSTLRMKVDEHGLRYEIKMPETRRDLVESIERGDIRGSSFSFIVSPGGEEWSVEEGRSIRTVKSIASLIDVGPVTFPAYPDASVAVARRSYDQFMMARSSRSEFADYVREQRSEIEKFLKERGR